MVYSRSVVTCWAAARPASSIVPPARTVRRVAVNAMAASLAWLTRQNEPGRGMRQPPVAAPRAQAHAGARSRSGSGTMRVRAILLATALVTSITAGPTRADVLIAVAGPLSLSPMTAKYATFGEELQRGAELAVRDVNERG